MELANLLNEIEHKAQKLKSRNERLEKDNTELQQSVFNYLQQLDKQKKEITNLKEQISIASAQPKTSTLSKTLEKEIDKYIALIDKNIASLQNKFD